MLQAQSSSGISTWFHDIIYIAVFSLSFSEHFAFIGNFFISYHTSASGIQKKIALLRPISNSAFGLVGYGTRLSVSRATHKVKKFQNVISRRSTQGLEYIFGTVRIWSVTH